MPRTLVTLVGRAEIFRSLRTSSYMEARQRAAQAWLATENVFRDVALQYKTLSAEQAELIVARLIREPLWKSPTTDEILEGVDRGHHGPVDLIFAHLDDITPTLTEEQSASLALVLERVLERSELQLQRDLVAEERLRTQLRELRTVAALLKQAKAVSAKLGSANDRPTSVVKRVDAMAHAQRARRLPPDVTSPPLVAAAAPLPVQPPDNTQRRAATFGSGRRRTGDQ